MGNMVTLITRSEENEFRNIKEFNGQLYVVKVLLYYDYPRLFVCQNENDELYLFNETQAEKDLEGWGVIKIDYNDLVKFCKNELSFRDLYIIYGDSYWNVEIRYTNNTEKINIVKAEPTELLEFYSEDEKLFYDATDSMPNM